ncbi:hypothetical protein BKA62DRAFT_505951 [Auriculariales sp. MPI-PUGE-AT-0066]|nr:hypothetical protein BKA62DRAFT_505951 [Auriculariales sp. MPI-PUGE-AT-0066]
MTLFHRTAPRGRPPICALLIQVLPQATTAENLGPPQRPEILRIAHVASGRCTEFIGEPSRNVSCRRAADTETQSHKISIFPKSDCTST